MAAKKLEAIKAKSSSDPDLKAGLDATITDGSFVTILSMGSAGMLTKFIDFD